jgi:acetate kinase
MNGMKVILLSIRMETLKNIGRTVVAGGMIFQLCAKVAKKILPNIAESQT